MKRGVRKILFYGFALAFVVSATYMLMVAQGLALDVQNFKLVKTGAVFLKFNPDDAVISVNGKPQNKSKGFLRSGIFLNNLTPKEYEIVISKNGFYSWVRKLKVYPGLISSASQIKLWPDPLKETPIISKVSDFWVTSLGLVYKNDRDKILFDEEVLKGEGVVLASEKSTFLITDLGGSYFLINLENYDNALNLTNLFNSLKQRQLLLPGEVPIKNVFFHPFSSQKILIITDTSLYALDIKKVQLERLLTVDDSIKDASVSNSDVTVLGEEAIISYSLLLKNPSLYPLDITNAVRIGVSSDGNNIILLTKNGSAFDYDKSLDKSDLISENINDFYFSPDKKRAFLVGKDESSKIYYFENFAKDNEYVAHSLVELPIKVEENPNFYWLPGANYGILKSNDSIYAVELDSGSLQSQNYYKLESSVIKFIWSKKLYILKSNGTLFEVEGI